MVFREKLTDATTALLFAAFAGGCVGHVTAKPDVITPSSELSPNVSMHHRFLVVGVAGVRFVILGSSDSEGPFVGQALLTRNGLDQSEFLSTDSYRLGEKVYSITSESFAASEISVRNRRQSWTGALQRGYGRAVSEPLVPEIQVQILRSLLSKDDFVRDHDCRLFIFGTKQALFGLEFGEAGLERLLQIAVVDGIKSNEHMGKLLNGSCIQYDAPYGSLAIGSLYRGHLLLTGSKVQISWRVMDKLTQM